MDYKGRKQKRKRIIAGSVAFIIIAAMLMSLIAPFLSFIVKADSTFPEVPIVKNQQFDMKAEIGFDGEYVVTKTTPFKITVTNNGNNFDGELQIKIKSYDYENSGVYSIYYIDANLPSGASKEFNMDINVETLEKKFFISLVDKKQKTVFSRYFNVKALDPSLYSIAVLSQGVDSLNYLKIDGCTYINLNKDTFPKTLDVLNSFDGIIINDFDTKTLSKESLDVLSKWIEIGGILIVGTGYNDQKVLSGLKDITGIDSNSSQEVYTSTLFDTEDDSKMTIAELSVPEGSTPNYSDGSFGYLVKKGTGSISVYTFDLADAPSLRSSADAIYFSIDFASKYMYNEDKHYSYATTSMPFLEKGGVYIIFVIIFLYIVIIWPVLYIVLKKKKKMEKGLIFIPAFSIAFMLVIYFIGFTSLYKNDFLITVSEIYMNEDDAMANAFVTSSIHSKKKGDIDFKIDKKYDFYINTAYYAHESRERAKVKIYCDSDRTEIKFLNNESWSTNDISTQIPLDVGGAVETDLNLVGASIVGKIYNNTLMDLEDLVLHYENNFMLVGDVKSKEYIEVDFDVSGSNYYYDMYDFTNEAFGFIDSYQISDAIKQGQISQEDAFQISKRISHLRNLNSYYPGGFDGDKIPLKVYAFNDDSIIDGNKRVNGTPPYEFYDNVFNINITVGINTEDDKFEIPFGILKPYSIEIPDGNYDLNNSYIYLYSESDITVYFELPFKNLKFFQIKWEDIIPFGAKAQIYNSSTEEFEELKAEEYFNVADYINNGQIIIKSFIPSEIQVNVPQIRLGGEI